MIYIATAYRFGFYNWHSYLVCVGTDKPKVLARAEKERDDRAGKYGVEVCEYPEDAYNDLSGDCDKEVDDWPKRGDGRVAYFNSVYNEPEPVFDSREPHKTIFLSHVLYAADKCGGDVEALGREVFQEYRKFKEPCE